MRGDSIGGRDHVETILGHFLSLNAIAEFLEILGQDSDPLAASSPVTDGISISSLVSSNKSIHVLFVPFCGSKNSCVQSPDCFVHTFFFDRKRKIDTRRALRNQRHVDVADRAEYFRRNSRRSSQTFSNNTNDRSPFFNSHRSESFKFLDDRPAGRSHHPAKAKR